MRQPLHVLLCLSLFSGRDVAVEGFLSNPAASTTAAAGTATQPQTATRQRQLQGLYGQQQSPRRVHHVPVTSRIRISASSSSSSSSLAATRAAASATQTTNRGPSSSIDNTVDVSSAASVEPVTRLSRVAPTPRSERMITDRHHVDDGEDDDLDIELFSFQQLKASMGTDVLDETLQQQIDTVTNNPNEFLDIHMAGYDATHMEKVAMSSIPEQLPQPAVTAMTQLVREKETYYHNNQRNQDRTANRDSTKKKAASRRRNESNVYHSSAQRLSYEEELELGRMIQRGTQLFKIKESYESSTSSHQTSISRSEWARLANCTSAQIRRDIAAYRSAKQLLVSANVGLVHEVARKHMVKLKKIHSGIYLDEVVQEGTLGLIRAAELFDPSRGLRFSTYATIWIKGTLQSAKIGQQIQIPRRRQQSWTKLQMARQELHASNGYTKEPTLQDIAAHLQMNVADIADLYRTMEKVSGIHSLDHVTKIQRRSGTDQDLSLNQFESDRSFQSDVDLAERVQFRADIVAAMARNLTPREARLIRLRYGLTDGHQRSFLECADSMGLSKTSVQRIYKKCIQKLRDAADVESLDEYLLQL